MLERISINKLFGRYDYDIDLLNGSSYKGLLFLTGPNGMGKTTIFKMINSLYKTHFEYFFSVPFDDVIFKFDNGYSVEFSQTRVREESDDRSDVPADEKVSVLCRFVNNGGSFEFSWKSFEDIDEQKADGIMSALLQYLKSDNCFYISDDRPNAKGEAAFDDSNIEPSVLTKLLNKIQGLLVDNYLITDYYSIDDNLIARIEKIKKKLAILRRFGLFMIDWEKKIDSLKGEDLTLFISKCEVALASCKNEISLVEEFLKMVDKASFVDKKIVLSPVYGYRFRLTDSGMFVDFDKMSSGERQYFCLMYNLFFVVQDKLLVLIDEPEISFHLMWQMSFCKQMKSLVKLKKLNLLVATHSTEMFDGDFSLTSDLYKQQKK